jgi:uncharacterized protein with von Willebrand factor type A (vWA) domain
MAVRPMAAEDVGPAIRLRLSGFVRTLRENGFKVGLAETRDALALLSDAGMDRPTSVRPALRALFCSRRSDWDGFDALFDAFWSGRGVRSRVAVSGGSAQASQRTLRTIAAAPGRDGRPSLPTEAERRADGLDLDAEPSGRKEGASRHHSLASADFRKLADPEAIAAAHALAERLARSMRARLTWRDRIARRGTKIDLRRTLRASLATGGVPLAPVRRRPRHKPLRIVLLLDASGSMSLYTSLFVRFAHGLLDHFREAEAFLFHTRLVHVSDAMKEKDAGRALDRLGLMAEGVGGGTRISDSLATFNRWHAARVIHGRTCIIIMSDGYDTGAPEALASEMAALRRRCRRIAWLNPLIGWDGYTPEARGMQAALPFLDLFAPAHSIESLQALEPYLSRL